MSLNGSQIEIARQQGQEAMGAQMRALLGVLAGLSRELRSKKPDKSKVKQLYEHMKGSWVPGVIISVVRSVIAKALGA